MKHWLWILVVSLVLSAAFLLYNFKDSIIANRHRLVEVEWQLPIGRPALLDEALALEGLAVALRASAQESNAWKPLPISIEAPESVLRIRPSSGSGVIVLGKSNSSQQLFVNFELNVTNRLLKMAVSRGK
jgi:hypothetical protein